MLFLYLCEAFEVSDSIRIMCKQTKHLYIIGNGFDLHHDMKTDYQEFYRWVTENDYDAYTAIIENFEDCSCEWWKHFEQNLAFADTFQITTEEVAENYPDFGSDDFRDANWDNAEYAVEYRLEKVYSTIRKAFHNWIGQLKGGNPDKKIKIEIDNAIFLNFNYSHTLQDMYNISEEKIFYIHGKAGTQDELVLGHGRSNEDIKAEMKKNEPPGNYDEEWNGLVAQRAKDAAISVVCSQRKEVYEIIKAHKDWFESLNDVSHIHLYGHSLGEVDLPYFHEILSSVDKHTVDIEVSDFQGKNKKAIESFMAKEGITRYRIIELNDF